MNRPNNRPGYDYLAAHILSFRLPPLLCADPAGEAAGGVVLTRSDGYCPGTKEPTNPLMETASLEVFSQTSTVRFGHYGSPRRAGLSSFISLDRSECTSVGGRKDAGNCRATVDCHVKIRALSTRCAVPVIVRQQSGALVAYIPWHVTSLRPSSRPAASSGQKRSTIQCSGSRTPKKRGR